MQRSLKLVSYLILLLMLTAIAYGGFITIRYWAEITV